MATMASAVRDIPTTFGHRDNLTAVAARSVPVTRLHSQPLSLPTPPNSISPSLPVHGLKAQLQSLTARLEPIDSDLDLQDGHNRQAGASGLAFSPLDSAGAITPAMLAKFHLPDILLNHGPLAIRHVMGYLTTSVPGFAGIPPAKARRLVVSALEGRGGEGGGLIGDVEFEKVGWGRWDARRRGQPSRERRASPTSGIPVCENGAIPIGKAGWKVDRSLRLAPYGSSNNGDGDSAVAFSHDDRDITMLEHEADRMSMDDGSASASCSEAPDDDVAMKDDPEDVTDDEDWAAVGAAALRATSYSTSAQGRADQSAFSSRVYTSGGGLRSFSATGGMARPPQLPLSGCNNYFDFPGSALPGTSEAQEREAIEALLRLGSM